MLHIKLAEIQQAAPQRSPDNPQAYIDDVLSAATYNDGTIVTMTLDAFTRVRNKYQPDLPQTTTETVAAALKGAASVLKTTVGIQTAATEERIRRTQICAECPSKVVVLKNGKPFTCGKLLELSKSAGKKTCGCVLSAKVKDIRQHCPNGHW